MATGVTGLTSLSPSMSYSAGANELAFTVFSKSNYQIHKLIPGDGVPFTVDSSLFTANVTLPPPVDSGIVMSYLENPAPPVSPDSVAIGEYTPSFHLYYLGQMGAVTANRYGLSVGGNLSIIFSDLLGNHLAGLTAQVNGGLMDLGGELFYLNRSYRTNWGIALSHTSDQVINRIAQDTVIDGRNINYIRQRVFDDQARLWLEHPFSTNRRFELGGSFSRVSYNLTAGTSPGQQEVDLEDPSSLDVFRSSLAYVGDYSFFGFTSPIFGRRYRFELEPTAGSVNFIGALADYRQYFFLQPFTLAFRLLHQGRYLGDSESDLLSPLFLGNQNLVRGYSIYSLNLDQCTGTSGFQNCPELNRLLGSRIAVANAEFRIPLLGPSQLALIPFPYLPVELAAFADAGAAWSQGGLPTLDYDDQTRNAPVVSAGGAARINLLNVAILQFYYAYPFQRTDTNWNFGFLISPGW